MLKALKRRQTTAERCVDAIRAEILSGRLRAGDKLPPERELAETLGVNRLTLRTALGQLLAAGLVRVKQGSGYTVEAFRLSGGPELLPALARLHAGDRLRRVEMCADLLLTRRHLAHAALSKLASLSDVDSAPIAAAIEDFAVAMDKSVAEIAAADVRVVSAILDATGSVVFRLALNPIAAALDELPELRGVIYREPAHNLGGYRALLTWLEARDSTLIPALVRLLEDRDQATVDLLRNES